MNLSELRTRRQVLKSAGVAATTFTAFGPAAVTRGETSSNRIRVGVIGCGVRGKYLIGNLPDSAQVTAVCDCAATRMAETLHPPGKFATVLAAFADRDAARCTMHQDYRALIDRNEQDAVIIATPDHHHVQAAMLALDAGLDVYLEKPLSVTIREGRVLADKVKATGRVLQVGSQQRTMEMNRFACEFIRDGGLGKVSRVDFPNYPGPIANPDFPAEPVPEDLAWDLFLGPTPRRPHNRKLWIKDDFMVGELLWRGWDLFRDYSGHLMTNWGAHSIDMVQYALGMDHTGPVRITPAEAPAEEALERDWQEKWSAKTPRPAGRWQSAARFHPVTVEYGDGTLLNLKPGIDAAIFHGERGRMLIRRNYFETEPADLVTGGPDAAVATRWDGDGHVARPHLQNWIDAIEGRADLNAPVEIGHRTITVCHLVNIARELHRSLRWDPTTERFLDDPEADRLLTRPRREGFRL